MMKYTYENIVIYDQNYCYLEYKVEFNSKMKSTII